MDFFESQLMKGPQMILIMTQESLAPGETRYLYPNGLSVVIASHDTNHPLSNRSEGLRVLVTSDNILEKDFFLEDFHRAKKTCILPRLA